MVSISRAITVVSASVSPCGRVLVAGELHADDEVLSDRGADAVDDLFQEPHPMLERAAPLVVATVAVRREELRDQVAAIGRVDLDAVVAAFACPHGRIGVGLDQLLDVLGLGLLRHLEHRRAGDVTRADERQLRNQARGLTARVAKLADDLRAVRVNGVRDHLVFRDDRVVEASRRRAEQPAVRMDDIERRHDERDAALRTLGEVRGLPLGRHAFVRKAVQVRRRHDAIAELDVSDLEGREEMLELWGQRFYSKPAGVRRTFRQSTVVRSR